MTLLVLDPVNVYKMALGPHVPRTHVPFHPFPTRAPLGEISSLPVMENLCAQPRVGHLRA